MSLETQSFLNEPIYKQTMMLIDQVCLRSGVDESHGLAHAMKIANHVKKTLDCMPIEEKPSQSQYQNVILAALLHDVDDHKYFRTQNLENACNILTALNLDQQRVKMILRMIQLVSFSKNGNKIYPEDPIYFYFPRYADRVQAIGLIGLYRTYLYSQRVNNPFYTLTTQKPIDRVSLYSSITSLSQEYIKRGGKSTSTIDHIFDKLLHIQLPQEIQNEYLKELYQKGHQYLVDFVLQHAKEGYQNAEKELIQRMERQQEQKVNKKGREVYQ